MSDHLDQNEESLNVSAKTVDEAVEQGLAQLGLSRNQVEVEIVREGKRGVFGLGSEEAHVRLTPKKPLSVEGSKGTKGSLVESATAAFDQASAPADDLPGDKDLASQLSEKEPDNEVATIAERHLNNLLKHMGIRAEVTSRIAPDLVEAGESPPLVLDITGKDLGILIGRRSETLRALQYMVRLMVSKDMRSWQPIVVDVAAYRARRRRSLRNLAEKMAERAVATRKRVVLEAMPAYERRIIHIALKDHPDIFTRSIGSDDNRKVTIIPK